jgi:small subunit ribosomal protein S4
VIAVSERAKEHLRIKAAVETAVQRGIPEWLDLDDKKLSAVLKAYPDRSDLPSDIQEQLVVELYSK